MKAAQQHFNFLLLLVLVRTTTGFAAATFSDANWTTMGSQPGASGPVFATPVDSSGNLYIGGSFSTVGNVFATNIAKWNGSSWSALGSGMGGSGPWSPVYALAMLGNDL